MSSCRICGAELYGSFCPRCGAAQNENAEPPRAPAANPYEAGSAPSPPPSGFEAPDIPGFLDAFPACFLKFASIRGRASRPEFWYFALWLALAILVYGALAASFAALYVATDSDYVKAAAIAVDTVFPVIMLLLFIPLLAAACRRLHDSGRSGRLFWGGVLLGLAMNFAWSASPVAEAEALGYWLVFGLAMNVLLAAPPTPGPNKYGSEPKKRG